MVTPISDRSIIQQVQNKIASRGICSPCRVVVTAQNGRVTLSGSVQHTYQKGSAVQAANAISGVRQIVDNLIVKAVVKQ